MGIVLKVKGWFSTNKKILRRFTNLMSITTDVLFYSIFLMGEFITCIKNFESISFFAFIGMVVMLPSFLDNILNRIKLFKKDEVNAKKDYIHSSPMLAVFLLCVLYRIFGLSSNTSFLIQSLLYLGLPLLYHYLNYDWKKEMNNVKNYIIKNDSREKNEMNHLLFTFLKEKNTIQTEIENRDYKKKE